MALLVGLVKICKILPLVNGNDFFYHEIKSQYILVVLQHFHVQ